MSPPADDLVGWNPEHRLLLRSVPKRPVWACLGHLGVHMFGTLSNICNFGACFDAEYHLSSGREVTIAIGFHSLSGVFRTRGRIVWSRSTGENINGAGFLHGVRFTGLDDSARETLRRILSTAEFQEYREQPAPAPQWELDELLRDLEPELEALGRKLRARLE